MVSQGLCIGRSAVVVQGLCRKGFVEGQPWLSRGYVGQGLWKVSRGCPGVMYRKGFVEGQPWLSRGYV